jgi:hypothetical protein
MVTAIHNIVQPNASGKPQVRHSYTSPELRQADAILARHHSYQPPLNVPMNDPGINPLDFVRDNRIHIKHGSQFIDGYLVIHPRELVPENETALREKLKLTYSVNYPSFYEADNRRSVAFSLAQLVPISMQAKHASQLGQINAYNAQTQTGVDVGLKRQLDDRAQPMAANVRDMTSKHVHDPIGQETLKNGLAMHLLLREKLTRGGYLNPLTSYAPNANSPDQVLTALADKIGATPLAMREAAASGGIDGVAALLAIEPQTLADIKRLTEMAAASNFSLNKVLDWHVGHQLMGTQKAPLEQVMARGLAARIDDAIATARRTARGQYEVGPAIQAQEKQVAESLNLLEPIQRALMHKAGYEICFSPDYVPQDIAFYKGIKGLNRRTFNDPRSTSGTKRIYFSAYEGLEESTRVLAHEAAHIFWPHQFAPAEVQKIDALVASDAARFKNLSKLVDEKFPEFERFLRAYQAGNDAEKAAIAQTTNAYFAGYGVSIGDGLLPYLTDANQLRYLVKYATDKLMVDGKFYLESSYATPQERFREVISRFAEIKQVRLRGEPQLMQFLAPGLNQVWENHYLPHLARVYQQMVADEKTTAPSTPAAATPPLAAAASTVPTSACTMEHVPSTNIAAGSAQLDGVGITNPAIAAAMGELSRMGAVR